MPCPLRFPGNILSQLLRLVTYLGRFIEFLIEVIIIAGVDEHAFFLLISYGIHTKSSLKYELSDRTSIYLVQDAFYIVLDVARDIVSWMKSTILVVIPGGATDSGQR